MPAVAALPAVGLLAGAAFGLSLPEFNRLILLFALAASIGAVVVGWWSVRSLLLGVAVALTFASGGALIAIDAWQRAWRPPLRVVFEQLASVQREDAAAGGRRLPQDDEAFAIVEGALRADASPGQNGVSLSVAVERVGREGQEGQDGQDGQDGQEGARGFSRATGGRLGSSRATGGIVVTVVGSLAANHIDEWRAGRRVRFPVTLHRPSRYLDPGVPDHERALARRGTTLVGTVKSGALVEVLARASTIDEAMGEVRAFARRAIADAVGRWSPQSGAIVTAIVIGDRAGLDDEIQRRLQEAGTYHVIAISGGNIAILAGLLIGAFKIAGWFGRGAMIAAIALLLVYARLVGDGASVDRATLMAVVYFGARALDLRSATVNALAVVAGVLVAIDPLALTDPAFVLTFGATLGILIVMPGIAKGADAKGAMGAKGAKAEDTEAGWRAFARRLWTAAVAMFAASAAAEAMLLPVGALLFGRVTFAGLALNFAAIPLMAVAQVAGMCVVPLALASSWLAAAAGWVAHIGAAGLIASARLLRFAPALAIRVAPPAPAVVIIYYCALVAAWRWRWRPGRRAAAALAAGAASVWILADPPALLAASGDGRLHVTFVDVGQGDAALVRFPRGSTLLVDTGGLPGSGFDVGDRVVAPVLRALGVRRLDRLALTHGDPDHIGGAATIIRDFGPREVWEGIPVPRSAALTALRLQTQVAGARWANVYAGDRTTLDDVEIVARHPHPGDWERQKVRNDDSLVLELRWRNVSILLTGDIGRAVEPSIAAATPASSLRIVKIPHHGSVTSSGRDFVAALHPAIAVVSAGRNNHFGHPAPEVLARYRDAGAEVFRTDQDGAVTIDTDGTTIGVRTYTGRTFSAAGTTKTRKHEDRRRSDAQNR